MLQAPSSYNTGMVTLAHASSVDTDGHDTNKLDQIVLQRTTTAMSGTEQFLPRQVTDVPREFLRSFPHSKRVGNYLLGRTLGEGSFAKVKEALHALSGEKVAVKVIDKKRAKEDSYVRKNLRREGKLLQLVRHANVAQLYEVMETQNFYYLVVEMCEGGDLMEHICTKKRLEEKEVRKYMRQIISAVEYLHRAGILHRDLKVENLLLSETKDIKIIDFGLSNSIKVTQTDEGCKFEEFLVTQCGSPAYAAPELLANRKYGPQVDVWSIGVNMYAMLTGNLPFTVHPFNIKTLLNKMMNHEMNPLPEGTSRGCKDLVRRLLNPDPEKRISLTDAMQHTWLNEGRTKPLDPVAYPNRLRPDDLDQSIIKHMSQNMNFKMSEIIRMVISNIPHSTTATYHLFKRKLLKYNAEMRILDKVVTSNAKASIQSNTEGKSGTGLQNSKSQGENQGSTKIVRPTPISVGTVLEAHNGKNAMHTRRAEAEADDNQTGEDEYLEIQISRKFPMAKRRMVRRPVKNERVITKILNVRNTVQIPLPHQDTAIEFTSKNPGITTDAFQLDRSLTRGRTDLKLRLPDANKAAHLICLEDHDLPWKRGNDLTELPDFARRYRRIDSHENSPQNCVVGQQTAKAVIGDQNSSGDSGNGASSDDNTDTVAESRQNAKLSTTDSGDSNPEKKSVSFDVQSERLRDSVTTAEHDLSHVIEHNNEYIPQKDHKVDNSKDTAFCKTVAYGTTKQRKMNSTAERDSTESMGSWRDYVSRRKVVDAKNYEMFARTRSRTMSNGLISRIPSKDSIKELMASSPTSDSQGKFGGYSTRAHKVHFRTRPAQPKYLVNNLMGQTRILKRRESLENRASLTSTKDSGHDLRDDLRSKEVSSVGLPSISPIIVKKRT